MPLYIRLLRCHQWLKNLFVFAPAFFANRLFHLGAFSRTFLAFCAFSLVASAVYIFNDLNDVEFDRAHPQKCRRPIAAGEVLRPHAISIALVCLLSGLLVSAFLGVGCVVVLLAYVVLNVLYSLSLKRVAVLDIFIISLGFILRLLMGGEAINLGLSAWISVMTFLLAMFLALAKRRDDLVIEGGEKSVRAAIDGYNLQFIDISLAIMASVVLVAYLMYCLSPEVMQRMGENTYLTFVFVVLGLLRYLQITFVFGESGSPTMVLIRDKFIRLIVVGWVALFAGIFILKDW